jgi:hypothetical protein
VDIDQCARGMLIEEIDGAPAALHAIAPFLAEAGFIAGELGMQAILGSRLSSIASRPSAVVGRQSAGARRPSKSLLSSPFAARNFEPAGEDESS